MKKIKKEDHLTISLITIACTVGVFCALNGNYTAAILTITILIQIHTIIEDKSIIKTIATSINLINLINRLKEDKSELKKVVREHKDRLNLIKS